MSPLRVRRFLRPSRRSLVLVAVLLALAGADLAHHLAAAHAGSHNEVDICLAVVGGIAFTAAAVVALALSLPRPSYGTTFGSGSLCALAPPKPSARAGPISTVVLRL